MPATTFWATLWMIHWRMARGGEGVGGVGAHAAGVGAGVAFADALVVLGGGDRDGVVPSQRAKKESSSPVRNSSRTISVSAVPRRAPEKISAAVDSASAWVLQMTTPLPAARPDALTTTGVAKRGSCFADFVDGGAEGVGGGGDVVALHEVLGEGFAGLEAGGGLGGAEDAESWATSLSTMPRAEGDFGADDGEIGVFAYDDVEEGLEAVDVDGDAAGDLRQCRRCRVRPMTSVTRGEWRRDQTMACSRPPPPITRTFIDFQTQHFLGTVPALRTAQSSDFYFTFAVSGGVRTNSQVAWVEQNRITAQQ